MINLFLIYCRPEPILGVISDYPILVESDIAFARNYLTAHDDMYADTFNETFEASTEVTRPAQNSSPDTSNAPIKTPKILNNEMKEIIGTLTELIKFMKNFKHFETIRTHLIPKMVSSIVADVIYLQEQMRHYAGKITTAPANRSDKVLRAKKIIEGNHLLSQCFVRVAYIRETVHQYSDIVKDMPLALGALDAADRTLGQLRDQLWFHRTPGQLPTSSWITQYDTGLAAVHGEITKFQRDLKPNLPTSGS